MHEVAQRLRLQQFFDRQPECFGVARTTFPIYHPVGTCAIGSVVDAELRVEGLEALRVVDASVMPTVTRGNTNAPTIAVAERAADLIKGEAPLRAGAAEQPA